MPTQSQTEGLAGEPAALNSSSTTNLPVVDRESATGEVAALYQHYRSAFGRSEVPGIVKCFATNTAMLRSMMDLAQNFLFTESELSRCHKEMIAAFVSNRNQCPYCADSHGYFMSLHGGSAEALCAVRQGDLASSALSAAEQELLRFADKVNSASETIWREDIAQLQQAGWSNQQISEAIHVASLFSTFNRIANAFGLQSQGLLDSANKR